jgi:hypothetical protein
MSALSTPTAPTTDSSSGFSPDQQEKALRDVQDRLLAVKRVLSVVQQDSTNNSCVVPESSIDEIRRLKFNLCTALNPSDRSAHGRLLGRVSFDLSCSPSATVDVPLKKHMDNRIDKLGQLSTYKSLPPIERKVRFHGKFSEMAKTHRSSDLRPISNSHGLSYPRPFYYQIRQNRAKNRYIQALGVLVVSIPRLVFHILPPYAHYHWLNGVAHP